MKKFYISLLSSAIVLSAAALERQQADFTRHTAPVKTAAASINRHMPTVTAHKASVMATEDADLSAINAWEYYNHLNGSVGDATTDITVDLVDPSTGEVHITITELDFTIIGQYNASAGTLTLEKQQIGEDSDGIIYLYFKEEAANGSLVSGERAEQTVVGTVSGTTITFPADDIWALGDPDAESLGWYILSTNNVFTQSTWESLGEGQFLENIVYPLFTNEQNTQYATVEVAGDGKGHYIVSDPLKSLYANLDFNDESPQLELDATDPHNVLIPLTSTGIGDPTSQQPYLYYSESWVAEEDEEFKENLRIRMTVSGEEVTITIPYQSTSIWVYNTESFYYGSAYVSILKFNDPWAATSIKNIETSDISNTSSPVRYFNLQGRELSKPAAGTFVIRLQGNKASKEYIR